MIKRVHNNKAVKSRIVQCIDLIVLSLVSLFANNIWNGILRVDRKGKEKKGGRAYRLIITKRGGLLASTTNHDIHTHASMWRVDGYSTGNEGKRESLRSDWEKGNFIAFLNNFFRVHFCSCIKIQFIQLLLLLYICPKAMTSTADIKNFQPSFPATISPADGAGANPVYIHKFGAISPKHLAATS